MRSLSTGRPGFLRYWLGRYWLRSGYCPRCYSSPPRPECDVCAGNREYGPVNATALTKARWRWRWEAKRDRLT